jgi:hypothetical protein
MINLDGNRLLSVDDMLASMVEDRTENICSSILIKHPKIRAIEDRCGELFHQITFALPQDQKTLMLDYDSLSNEVGIRTQEIMYEQGLRDGMRLMQSILCSNQLSCASFHVSIEEDGVDE